jgi:hypothetical protein
LVAGAGSRAGNGKSKRKVVKDHKPLFETDVLRLFIIDGVISLPIALAGFFVLPDVPEIANPWYMSKKVNAP